MIRSGVRLLNRNKFKNRIANIQSSANFCRSVNNFRMSSNIVIVNDVIVQPAVDAGQIIDELVGDLNPNMDLMEFTASQAMRLLEPLDNIVAPIANPVAPAENKNTIVIDSDDDFDMGAFLKTIKKPSEKTKKQRTRKVPVRRSAGTSRRPSVPPPAMVGPDPIEQPRPQPPAVVMPPPAPASLVVRTPQPPAAAMPPPTPAPRRDVAVMNDDELMELIAHRKRSSEEELQRRDSELQTLKIRAEEDVAELKPSPTEWG